MNQKLRIIVIIQAKIKASRLPILSLINKYNGSCNSFQLPILNLQLIANNETKQSNVSMPIQRNSLAKKFQ